MKYKILIVDDEEEYCKSFKSNVEQIGVDAGHEIEIHSCHNWQDACIQLKAPTFDGVVLDAKCLVDNSQETENFEFLAVALSGLGSIEREQDRRIPFAVNTGYIGEREAGVMNRLIEDMGGKRFAKSEPKSGLVQYLVAEIDQSPGKWLEFKYEDVFEVFSTGELSPALKPKLVQLLMNIDEPAKSEENLRTMRVLQEEIYNALHAKGIFATNFNPRNSPASFNDKNFFLSGNEANYRPTTTVFQTSTIRNLATAIYKISSDFGNHVPQQPHNVPVQYWERPSVYAVKSLAFALLEQIVWMKKIA